MKEDRTTETEPPQSLGLAAMANYTGTVCTERRSEGCGACLRGMKVIARPLLSHGGGSTSEVCGRKHDVDHATALRRGDPMNAPSREMNKELEEKSVASVAALREPGGRWL